MNNRLGTLVPLLQRFIDNQPPFELQCISGIQSFASIHEHPSGEISFCKTKSCNSIQFIVGLLDSVLDILHDKKVLSAETFEMGKSSEGKPGEGQHKPRDRARLSTERVAPKRKASKSRGRTKNPKRIRSKSRQKVEPKEKASKDRYKSRDGVRLNTERGAPKRKETSRSKSRDRTKISKRNGRGVESKEKGGKEQRKPKCKQRR